MSIVRLIRRSWHLVLPMFLVTVGLVLLVAQSVPVTFEAKGTVLFQPSATAPPAPDPTGTTLPFNRFSQPGSGEVFAARIITTVMDDTAVKDELKAKGAGDFTIEMKDPTLPLLEITAEGTTAEKALTTVRLVADQMNQELATQQQTSNADPATFITTRPLLPTDKADKLYAGRIRAAVAVAALGLGATLSVPFLMEGIGRGRRRDADTWAEEQLHRVRKELPRPVEGREPVEIPD